MSPLGEAEKQRSASRDDKLHSLIWGCIRCRVRNQSWSRSGSITQQGLRSVAGAAEDTCLFCLCAWRWCRQDASFHGGNRVRARQTRRCDLALSIPLYGEVGERTDAPKLAHATVCAATSEAFRLLPTTPLIAGRKSFGGRMTSQAQAITPLASVRGLAFLGFPLHAAGHPAHDRGDHLFGVHIPVLFLQGTRDALADMNELTPLCEALGKRATLKLFQDADHSFHVPVKSGRTDKCTLSCSTHLGGGSTRQALQVSFQLGKTIRVRLAYGSDFDASLARSRRGNFQLGLTKGSGSPRNFSAFH